MSNSSTWDCTKEQLFFFFCHCKFVTVLFAAQQNSEAGTRLRIRFSFEQLNALEDFRNHCLHHFDSSVSVKKNCRSISGKLVSVNFFFFQPVEEIFFNKWPAKANHFYIISAGFNCVSQLHAKLVSRMTKNAQHFDDLLNTYTHQYIRPSPNSYPRNVSV